MQVWSISPFSELNDLLCSHLELQQPYKGIRVSCCLLFDSKLYECRRGAWIGWWWMWVALANIVHDPIVKAANVKGMGCWLGGWVLSPVHTYPDNDYPILSKESFIG